jgi:hypothetical protein
VSETVAGGKGFAIAASAHLEIDFRTLYGKYIACATGQTSTVQALREVGEDEL